MDSAVKEKSFEEILNENVKILQSNPVEIKQSNTLLKNEELELSDRSDLYTALLNAYVTDFDFRHKSNRYYKKRFFNIVMIIFCISIFGAIAVLMIIAFKGVGNSADITLVISSFATILSTLIIIPQIIAKYLFPLDEDDKVADMVKTMQQNDFKTRELHSNGPTLNELEKKNEY
ncbi:MAG: hypothetical protein Q8865_08975 [Bacillota bacterium]|nr:hypothetical protein [Bacillota bacterium]